MTTKNFGCLFEHFKNISGTLALESEVIVRRAGLTAQIIT
jgi:hypothetical protein